MPDKFGIASKLTELAPRKGKLLLAVSGGADSVALLRLVELTDWRAEVACINHGLRPEAVEETEFVRAVARERGLAFHTVTFDTRVTARARGWNIEETARTLRYQHLASIARSIGADHVVTAHNRDDNTETVLMQLMRGAAWLTGIPETTGKVIRPLLHVRKHQLTQWLSETGQEWREDATNFDTDRERAWLRNIVLPLLRGRHPDLDERVANLVSLQELQKEYLHGAARPFVDLEGGIDADRLRNRHRALQYAALAHMLRAHGANFGLNRLERAIQALEAGESWRESLGEDELLRLSGGRLEVIPTAAQAAVKPESVKDADQLPPGVSTRALELPDLEYRARMAGDRIRLSGGTRKLSDVLIDAKIPREDRDALRVLASGARVIWVDSVATAVDYSEASQAPGEAEFMGAALELAKEASAAGELPVGAVVVRDGRVLASARNETEASGDPTAHAELLAVRRAAETLGDWRLTDCTLYVTLEPCAMCFGAMQQAHLATVVYAARNRREGATGSVADLDLLPWKRTVKVETGPYAREASELLTEFFRRRRDGTP